MLLKYTIILLVTFACTTPEASGESGTTKEVVVGPEGGIVMEDESVGPLGPIVKGVDIVGPEAKIVKRDVVDDIIGTLKSLASKSPDLDTVKKTIAKNYERMQVYLSNVSPDDMLRAVVEVNRYLDTETEANKMSLHMAQLMRKTVADLTKDRLSKNCRPTANGAASSFSLAGAAVAALVTCSWIFLQ